MSLARFLADEDLRGSIIRAVRRMKPAVEFTTIVEQGLSSAADEEVLDFAWRERWLLVSHDVNTMKAFAERRISDGRGIHGLFLVPQSRPTRPVAECLVLIWSASEFEEWRGRIVYLPFLDASSLFHTDRVIFPGARRSTVPPQSRRILHSRDRLRITRRCRRHRLRPPLPPQNRLPLLLRSPRNIHTLG